MRTIANACGGDQLERLGHLLVAVEGHLRLKRQEFGFAAGVRISAKHETRDEPTITKVREKRPDLREDRVRVPTSRYREIHGVMDHATF